MGARTEDRGIRVNGIVTPHADSDLHDYLSQMPVAGGERMRALKQLAAIGLLMKRGATGGLVGAPVSLCAMPAPVVEAGATPAAVVAAQPAEPVQRGIGGDAVVQLDAEPAPVVRPQEPQPGAASEALGGSYDLSEMDLGDVDLTF